MKKIVTLFFVAAAVMASASAYAQKTSGNPIFEGDYADPEGIVFGKWTAMDDSRCVLGCLYQVRLDGILQKYHDRACYAQILNCEWLT